MVQIKRLVDVNSVSCIFAVAMIAAVVPATVVLGPIIVGAYVTDLRFSVQQAGYLISAELLGAGLATFIAYFAVSRFNWHSILRLALLLGTLTNIASALLSEFALLVPVRFATGLAVGTIMTMTIVIVGMTEAQERNFGAWSMGQVVFAVIGFAVFPQLVPVVGVSGFFLGMAAVMALLQMVVGRVPAAGNYAHQNGVAGLSPQARRLAPVALLALLFFYIGIGSVWAYVERIGDQAGLEAEFVGYVLSASSVIGVIGAGVATWLSTRMGRLLPVLGGYLLIGLSVALYAGYVGGLLFLAASLLFKFAWWFLSPYLLANMTRLDPSGRVAILTNFVIGVGLGGGPAIAAWLLGSGEADGAVTDFSSVIYLGLSCLAVSIALLVPIIRLNNEQGDENIPAS